MNPIDSSSDESRLAKWLREAAVGAPIDERQRLANVRRALLARLDAASHPVARPAVPHRLRQLLNRHRLAAGSLAVSTLLLAAALLVVLNSTDRLSAMERTAKELSAVTSYSFRLRWQSDWTEDDGKRKFTTAGDGHTFWSAPEAFYNETTIVKRSEDVSTKKVSSEVIEHFAEIFPVAKEGLLIDHLRKTFFRMSFEPMGSRTYPWDILRMIRERSYDVQRELGNKQIGNIAARGYVLLLKNPRPNISIRDPVELWVDDKTDLPIEFSYGGTNEGSTYVDRATDFRWNIEIDPQQFVATAPSDYADITPPAAPDEIAQITDALRLYAKLSGGVYPRADKFQSADIRDEMLKLAGFSGPKQPQWADDKSYRQIEQATAGLNWIERILRLRFLSGYRGAEVAPNDTQKVLLWWVVPDGSYHVIYGDLHSTVLSEAEWSKVAPEAQSVVK